MTPETAAGEAHTYTNKEKKDVQTLEKHSTLCLSHEFLTEQNAL